MSSTDLTDVHHGGQPMPYPRTLIHHDAPPSRDRVRVWTPARARIHTDVLMTQAHHQRTEGDR